MRINEKIERVRSYRSADIILPTILMLHTGCSSSGGTGIDCRKGGDRGETGAIFKVDGGGIAVFR